jgi:hypothetical protein
VSFALRLLLKLARFKKPKTFLILFVIFNDFNNLQISGYVQYVLVLDDLKNDMILLRKL